MEVVQCACTHVVDKSSSGPGTGSFAALLESCLLLLLGQDAGNWSTQHSVSCLYTLPGYNHLLPSILTDTYILTDALVS